MPSLPARYSRVVLGASLLTATNLVACSGSALSPRFEGHSGPRPTRVTALRVSHGRPDGASLLGDLKTRCRGESMAEELSHASLSDVDCSEGLLLRALHARAAEVGADLLIDPACEHDSGSSGVTIRCRASAAYVGSDHADDGGKFAALPTLPSPSFEAAEDAFRVTVSARLAHGEVPRKAVEASAVAELAFTPYGRVVRAHIVACGAREAGRDAVRHAVRAAAGRLGATDVVGIECARKERRFVCVGEATRPEVSEK